VHCGVETVRLETVPEIADLYRKLGFVDEYDFLRFRGRGGRDVLHGSDSTSPIKKERICDIAEFDAAYFGADRTRVLVSSAKKIRVSALHHTMVPRLLVP
jgi:hypothetical protein